MSSSDDTTSGSAAAADALVLRVALGGSSAASGSSAAAWPAHRVLTATATELAAAIRSGALTSVLTTQTFLDRIAAVNPKVNAVCELNERALEEAAARDAELERVRGDASASAPGAGAADAATSGELGPLHGVPVTVKERLAVAGMKNTLGSLQFKDFVCEHDCPVVARLKAAGAVVLGTTNEPELGLAYETDNLLYGRTVNPYNADRTCGGSSGGEAAILACAGSPLGLGSDMGGSVRYPAHCCGVVAVKPTSGRVPLTTEGPLPVTSGALGNRVRQWSPMGRCVDDVELELSVISGPDYDDPLALLPQYKLSESREGLPRALSAMRIGYYTWDRVTEVTADTRAAVEAAAEALRSAAVVAEVVEIDPSPMGECYPVFADVCGLRGSKGLDKLIEHPSPLTEAMIAEAKGPSVSDGAAAADLVVKWDALRSTMLRLMRDNKLDALLGPCGPSAAPEHGMGRISQPYNYTSAFNILGWPAITIGGVAMGSKGTVDEGLPVGVHVAAPPLQEGTMFAVARAVESAML